MILIHTQARKPRESTAGRSAKDYPYWKELLGFSKGERVIQIGGRDDLSVTTEFHQGLPLPGIKLLIEQCSYWIAVDSFLPHFAYYLRKPGVVLWSVSDPAIFGYPMHLNLLRDRKYLRPEQFAEWSDRDYNADAFMPAAEAGQQINEWRRGSRAHGEAEFVLDPTDGPGRVWSK